MLSLWEQESAVPLWRNNREPKERGRWSGPGPLQYAEAHQASQLPVGGEYHSRYHSDFDSEEEAKRYTRDHYHQYDNHKCNEE